jgi:hypothetical protein
MTVCLKSCNFLSSPVKDVGMLAVSDWKARSSIGTQLLVHGWCMKSCLQSRRSGICSAYATAAVFKQLKSVLYSLRENFGHLEKVVGKLEGKSLDYLQWSGQGRPGHDE